MAFRILVVDDHEQARRAIVSTLATRAEWEVCGEASNGVEGVARAKELRPDLILMDVSMPQMDGIEATRIIREQVPESPVILVSQNEPGIVSRQAAAVGAAGYVAKSNLARELFPAIAKISGATKKEKRQTREALLQEIQTLRDRLAQAKGAEDRLALATEVAKLGIWRWYPEEDRAVWENDQMYEIIGREHEEGPVSAAEFLNKVIVREDAEAFQRSLTAAMNNGQRFFFHGRVLQKDGSVRWIEFAGQMQPKSEARPRYMIGTLQDVTERKLAEHTVRATADRLRAIYDGTHEYIGLLSPDGTLLEANRASLEFGNNAREDVVGHPFWETVWFAHTPGAPEKVREGIQRAATGEFVRDEVPLRRPSGEEIVFDFSLHPIRGKDGKVAFIVPEGREVGDRKRAEAALNESEGRFRQVAESLPQLVWTCEPDGPCDYLSPQWVKFTGKSESQQLGYGWVEQVHPHDRERVKAQWQATAAAGKNFEMEFRIRRHDGEYRWFRTLAVPLRDSDGTLVKWFGSNTDVHDLKQSGEALQRSEERLRLAQQVSRIGTFEWNIREDVNVWSPELEALYGLPTGSFEGTFEAWKARVHPDDLPEAEQRAKESMSTGVLDAEWRILMPDGSLRWVAARGQVFMDDKGEPVRMVGLNLDITARKQLEENYRQVAEALGVEVRDRTRDLDQRNAEILRQAEQMRELAWRLLRAQEEERKHIARELHDSAGQTLAVLGMNFAQFVRKTESKDPELAKEAESIHEAVLQLHRDIRTASYLLHPPLLDETGLSSALSWYTEGLAERSGLEIELEIAPNFGRLPRDMELIVFRLVQECLINIHRHSGSKRAWISIGRDLTEVSVEIRDEGTGMSTAKLAAVQSGRSGVGIRGMRERLRQFRGEITVESGENGTRILVSIPIAANIIPEDESRGDLATRIV